METDMNLLLQKDNFVEDDVRRLAFPASQPIVTPGGPQGVARIEARVSFHRLRQWITNTEMPAKHWVFARSLPPHPSPLPKGEGGPFSAPLNAVSTGLPMRGGTTLPLPTGEGRGEGERRVGNSSGVVLTRSAPPKPAPR